MPFLVTLHAPDAPCVQVSFYRANLRFLVVRRPTGHTEEGKPCAEESIVQYIRRD